MTGIYIHVPFCEKRCTYCSFYSTTHGKKERDAFARALIEELRFRRPKEVVSSLYFGGGTPSQLDDDELTMLFKALRENCVFVDDVEITFEANPDDITLEKACQLVRLGINRVSLGVQSFDDRMLRSLNRRHNARQAMEAVEMLKQAGISNISIDLIYGLPGQSIDDWQQEVATALEQNIVHLSAYALSYEPGTVLYRRLNKGELKECEEELSLEMFAFLTKQAESAGFEHYEISNYARPGFRSRHNTSYWTGVPYIGLGPGAHSFDGIRTRRHNLPKLTAYNNSAICLANENEVFADVPHETEILSDDEHYNELIMTRLRTAEGLPLSLIDPQRQAYLLRMSKPHLKAGKLTLSPQQELRFTAEGIFLSDGIMADLMAV